MQGASGPDLELKLVLFETKIESLVWIFLWTSTFSVGSPQMSF